MSERLRVGVVGAGNIATIAQLPALVARADVSLEAVVTRTSDLQALERRWGFRRSHRSTTEMIEAGPLDAVFVLSPRTDHVASVTAALDAGLDVFCEKPLAPTALEAHQLADLAIQRNRQLMVGFNRRMAPTYRRAREAFGPSGAAFCIAQKHRHGSEYRATFENAVHMVDLLRWFGAGDVASVTATALAPDPWQEEGVAALVTFDNGNAGQLLAARSAGGWEERLDAYGDGKSAQVEAPDRLLLTDASGTQATEMRREHFGWATATETFGFKACVDHFLDRLRTREPVECSGREAARTQDLLEAILSSCGLPVQEDQGREIVSHAQR
jgi:virulence factor